MVYVYGMGVSLLMREKQQDEMLQVRFVPKDDDDDDDKRRRTGSSKSSPLGFASDPHDATKDL